jgi:hypothetical protein
MTIGLGGWRFRAVPVVGVRVTAMTETLKERMEGFAGRVSAIRVRLTVAPLTLQLTVQTCCFRPLQEDSERAKSARSARSVKREELLRFIGYPMVELVLFAHVPWTHGFPEVM